MDCSEFQSIVLKEIEYWQEQPLKSVQTLCFQNHLYGCISVLELIAEGEHDIEDNTIDNFHLHDLFSTIGIKFGFLNDNRSVFEGWSDIYREAWLWAWNTIGKEKES